MSAPAAGWFPDPAGRPDSFRWWDGTAWTRHLADDPSAPPPTLRTDPATEPPPAEAPSDAPASAATSAAPHADPAPTRRPASAYPPGYEPPHRPARAAGSDRSRWRGPIAGMVVLVAILVAGAAVLVVGRDRGSELIFPETAGGTATPGAPTSSAATPSAPPASAPPYDPSSRELTLPGLTVTMPGAPYETLARGDAVPDLLLGGASSWSVVEKDYDGQGSTWAAVVQVGKVDQQVAGGDVEQTADQVFDEFVQVAYDIKGRKIVKPERKTLDRDDGFAEPVRIINARVRYSVKGLESSSDKISLLVAPRPDGGFNAWISSTPNKADAKVGKALDACISSIRVN